jgi:hypothetical protein
MKEKKEKKEKKKKRKEKHGNNNRKTKEEQKRKKVLKQSFFRDVTLCRMVHRRFDKSGCLCLQTVQRHISYVTAVRKLYHIHGAYVDSAENMTYVLDVLPTAVTRTTCSLSPETSPCGCLGQKE